MFSVSEKQRIAAAVEQVIRDINHPEMNNDHITFTLEVQGAESWSYAVIHENSRTPTNPPNLWNEIARKTLNED